ncbi:hypothetical protein [Coraliomargarita parva]|uniref:hypothetical protein n=1 Tax=Coraliomargarita parva TaxID=3014050 RepID=UPI0022B3C9CD|nr:hypothetical protein [Coraliomargarita parva]
MSVASLLGAEFQDVVYKTGPARFRAGDSIQIESVRSTGSKLRVGETIEVAGTYHLSSRPAAKISVFVTQTEGDGRSQILPGQEQVIREGAGAFELRIDVRHAGYLHVSFYPRDGGSSFGGVYFGKGKQMNAIEDWTLDWYVKDDAVGRDTTRPQ